MSLRWTCLARGLPLGMHPVCWVHLTAGHSVALLGHGGASCLPAESKLALAIHNLSPSPDHHPGPAGGRLCYVAPRLGGPSLTFPSVSVHFQYRSINHRMDIRSMWLYRWYYSDTCQW